MSSQKWVPPLANQYSHGRIRIAGAEGASGLFAYLIIRMGAFALPEPKAQAGYSHT
jgi:hypothetical protein